MISIRNTDEQCFNASIPGAQTIANDLEAIIVPFDGVIRGILARLGTAGITGTQVTDVLINGVSIFSGATKMNFTTAKTPAFGALTTNPPTVSKGDIITFNTTGVHSGTAGKNLGIAVNIRRGRADKLGFDSDSVSFGSDAA